MYREDLKMPTKWTLLFVLPLIIVIIVLVVLMIAKPMGSATRIILIVIILAEIVFCIGVGVLFTTLHVSVENGVLTVGFRAFRERIPLEQITACTPVTYRWIEWGGYGIRINGRGKMYNVPGDGGHAVRVTLNNGRRVFFSSTDPDAACAAIRDAEGGRQAAGSRQQ